MKVWKSGYSQTLPGIDYRTVVYLYRAVKVDGIDLLINETAFIDWLINETAFIIWSISETAFIDWLINDTAFSDWLINDTAFIDWLTVPQGCQGKLKLVELMSCSLMLRIPS